MSDTPRTDASRLHYTEIAARSHPRGASAHKDVGYYVPAQLFRDLERELASGQIGCPQCGHPEHHPAYCDGTSKEQSRSTPDDDEIAWLRRFLNCTVFCPPGSEIVRAHRIVDALVARSESVQTFAPSEFHTETMVLVRQLLQHMDARPTDDGLDTARRRCRVFLERFSTPPSAGGTINDVPRYYVIVTADQNVKIEYPIDHDRGVITGFVESKDGAWMRADDVLRATPSATGAISKTLLGRIRHELMSDYGYDVTRRDLISQIDEIIVAADRKGVQK